MADPDLLTPAEADAIAEAWRHTRRPPGEAHTRRSWAAAQEQQNHTMTDTLDPMYRLGRRSRHTKGSGE